MLKTLADSVEASRFPSGHELQKFLLLHDGSLRHSFDNVAILDGKGNLVANLNGSEPIGKLNIEDREYFQRTLATMSGVISQPYRNRFSGLAQIAITEPVVGVDGRVVYVLSGSINLTQQNFLGELANIKFGNTGYMFITNTDGIVIDHPRKGRILHHFEAEGGRNLATEKAVAGFEGTTEAVNRVGVHGLYAFKQIRQTNWILGSIYPRNEAFARVDEIERLAWAGAIFLTVVAGILTFLTVHVQLVPLTRLHEHMQNSTGSAQYIPIQSMPPAGEIGDLARTFDALMRGSQAFQERLQASERFLRDVTDNLPAVVAYFDRDHRCLFYNKASLLVGVQPGAVVGSFTMEDALPRDLYALHVPHLAKVLSGHAAMFEGTYQRKGSTHFFQCHLVPDVRPDDEVVGYYVMTFDITRQKVAERDKAAGEARIRVITDNLPALVSHMDASMRYTFVNAKIRALHADEDLIGKYVPEVRSVQAFQTVAPYIARALAGETVTFEKRGDSSLGIGSHWWQVHLVPDRAAQGEVTGIYSMSFDITARKEAEGALMESEQRLRAITDNVPVLISYVDHEQRYRFANKTLQAWTGLDPHSVLGKTIRETIGAKGYAVRKPYIDRVLAGETVELELQLKSEDGTVRTVKTLYLPDVRTGGTVAGFYGLSTDVTAAQEFQSRLAALARVDVLTQLPNRLAFNEIMPKALARSRRTGDAIALMFLDIDHFKSINDTLGHASGDTVLIEFARRLVASVRVTDFVARLAGDEFVVVLENLSTQEAASAVAEKITETVSGSPFNVAADHIRVTTSIGVAFAPAGSLPAETSELLARADAALYAAKAAGRNTHQFAVV